MNIEWVEEQDMCVYLFIPLKHEYMTVGINFSFFEKVKGGRACKSKFMNIPFCKRQLLWDDASLFNALYTFYNAAYVMFSQILFHEIWEEKLDLWELN